MKIDRLIGILVLLLQNEKMTAPALAERFEVSRRTIGRDIETLSKAGIPIATVQGANGGISIMESYKIDKALLTKADRDAILTGLASLESVSYGPKYQRIRDKFMVKGDKLVGNNHLVIDLASFYKSSLAPKIEALQAGIEAHVCVAFRYFNKNGERPVELEPYLVVFRWSSWYAFGRERENGEFRLFKLNRMSELAQTNRHFIPTEIPADKRDFDRCFTDELHAVIRFAGSEKFRLIEEYGPDSFIEEAEGTLLFSFPFTGAEYLLQWVLSFGERARLIEPKEMRPRLKARLIAALENYDE